MYDYVCVCVLNYQTQQYYTVIPSPTLIAKQANNKPSGASADVECRLYLHCIAPLSYVSGLQITFPFFVITGSLHKWK